MTDFNPHADGEKTTTRQAQRNAPRTKRLAALAKDARGARQGRIDYHLDLIARVKAIEFKEGRGEPC